MKKRHRAKTNNQGQLQRRQNGFDATSRWIEFQKTRPRRRIQDKDVPVEANKISILKNSIDLWTPRKKTEIKEKLQLQKWRHMKLHF